MPKKNQNDFPSGFLIVDKPTGPTSHDVINRLRKITGVRKIGHAGTLDPAASGVLLVGIGRKATRQLGFLSKLDKEYVAAIRFGAVSDTYDREGKITPMSGRKIAFSRIKNVLAGFKGNLKQIPPMFSAKKIRGKKLYKMARAGETVSRKPSKITVYEIAAMSYEWPDLKVKVRCSSGTYIRSLAHDIGQTLGCGGYLAYLKRISVGEYQLRQAVKLIKLKNIGDIVEKLLVNA